MHTRLALIPLATFLVASAPFVMAQQSITTESQKLTASHAGGHRLGVSVAISGDTALVGAYGENGATGAAYVFGRYQGGGCAWSEVQRLTASDGSDGDQFGWSVALWGDTAVVAASREGHSYVGSAYVFERDQGGAGAWGEVRKLTASDATDDDWFGHSVSISGDVVVVGAPEHWVGSSLGAVYVYERDLGGAGNWGEVKQLAPSSADAHFGRSVAISGDTVVIGAPLGGSTMLGTAFVFERDQGGVGAWGEVQKLTAIVWPWDEVEFGASVAVSGDTAVVGAPGDSQNPAYSHEGAAYVFERDQGGAGAWGEVQKLLASDSFADEWFGRSVALSGDTAVVGAYRGDFPGAFDVGAAYVFGRDQGGWGAWGEVAKLTASDGAANDELGVSVALSGGTAVVGAWGDDTPGLSLGPVEGLAYDPGARVFHGTEVLGDQLLAIDPATGLGTPIGALGFGNVQGLALDPIANVLYGADTASDQLILIDTGSGAGTPVGSFGFPNAKQDVVALAFDPGGRILYGSRGPKPNSGTTCRLITIDTTTGIGSSVGPTGFTEVLGLAFDASTNTLYGADHATDQLIAIDPATGAGTAVGPLSFGGVSGLAFDSVTSTLHGAVDGYPDQLITIDTAIGTGAAVGPFSTFVSNSGAAYVFGVSFSGETYCTAGTSTSGCRATLSSLGTASATASSGFELVASTVEGAKDGIFFFGTCGRQAVPWGNGTSYKCVVPPVKRCGLLAGKGTAGGCNGNFTQDLNALWCPACPKPAHNPGTGALVQAQLWYRDPFSTDNQTTAFSDAIEFVVSP